MIHIIIKRLFETGANTPIGFFLHRFFIIILTVLVGLRAGRTSGLRYGFFLVLNMAMVLSKVYCFDFFYIKLV